MPGWPDFAACTASIAKARMAFAMSLCATASTGVVFSRASVMDPSFLSGIPAPGGCDPHGLAMPMPGVYARRPGSPQVLWAAFVLGFSP
jgi:hypothetical protein